MKTKSVQDLVQLYDSLRALEKAKASLYAGAEVGMASRVGGLAREIETIIETYEVIECRKTIQASLQK